jgi:hypothetical protein
LFVNRKRKAACESPKKKTPKKKTPKKEEGSAEPGAPPAKVICFVTGIGIVTQMLKISDYGSWYFWL